MATPDDAARALWLAHRRWVAAILLAHKPRGADLDDLLQDVALKLLTHAEGLRDAGSVRAWLRTVAVNTARTSGRRREVRRRLAPDAAAAAPERGEEDPGVAHAARDEGSAVMEVVMALPEEYREPLVLRAVRGMSYRQIADVMGVPVTTIETRLARARRMVRERMEGAERPTEVQR